MQVQAGGDRGHIRFQQAGHPLQLAVGLFHPAQRAVPGHGLNAPNARGDAGFRGDLEQADITGPRDMGAAAQFEGKFTADIQDAHGVFVLLAGQRQRAGGSGLGQRHDPGFSGHIGQDFDIDPLFDARDFGAAQGLAVREVKAQAVSGHQ